MGLAPLMVAKIFEVVRDIAAQGVTILLVEQNARLALEVAQRGYVMEAGTVVLADASARLLADPKVRLTDAQVLALEVDPTGPDPANDRHSYYRGVVLVRERADLHARIDERTRRMFAAGVIEEVRAAVVELTQRCARLN